MYLTPTFLFNLQIKHTYPRHTLVVYFRLKIKVQYQILQIFFHIGNLIIKIYSIIRNSIDVFLEE